MHQKTILLIDDEQDLLTILGFSLELWGFRVLTASCGQQGLELLRRESIDAVVTDIRMPGLNGMSLFRQIHQELPEAPPFIFSTGFSSFSVEEAYAEGVQAVLFKPFELADLQQAVEKATTRWLH